MSNRPISRERAGKGPRSFSIRHRALLVLPFVVGGVAAMLLVQGSEGPIIVGVGWLVSALAVATSFLLLTTAPSSDRPRRSKVRREQERSARWEAKPIGSLLVRVLAVLGPIGVSLATALAVQATLPAPSGGLGVVGQAILLMAIAFAVLYPAERATRKLAPIAMLLKLSLSFPSVAPSRFVVARRSANVVAVRQDLEAGRGDPAGNMLALIAALTAHDSRTRGHSERVRVFTEMLAQELGLDEGERERLRWSALMHDIGKLSVSAEILNKPARLDADQWKTMYTHPSEGARLIAPLAPWLGEWAAAVVEHHERLDGSGYPRGLQEGQISLGARIIAVADAFDSMVTPRTYHRPIAASAAREEVVRVSGMQFDPQVVRALLSISIPRLWWRIGIGAWLAQLPLLGQRRSSRARSESSAPGGVANLVGIVAIAVTAVLAPLGAIQTRLPAAPGSATEEAADPGGSVNLPEPDAESSQPSRSQPEATEDPDETFEVATGPAPRGTGDVEVSASSVVGPASGGQGGGGQGGGGQGGGAQDGVVGGVGAVGGAGTVIEANQDAVVAGQSTPPDAPTDIANSPSPVADPADGSGTPPSGEPSGESGHDKCKGQGHQHHEDDGC